jgi:hypothetical protein
MGLEMPPLNPGKDRLPKTKQTRALRRYRLKAAAEYRPAVKRKYGSIGAASPVRHIDPKGWTPKCPS